MIRKKEKYVLIPAQYFKDKIKEVYRDTCISKLTQQALKIIGEKIQDSSERGHYTLLIGNVDNSRTDEYFVWTCFEQNIEKYSYEISEAVCKNILSELSENGYLFEKSQYKYNFAKYLISWEDK